MKLKTILSSPFGTCLKTFVSTLLALIMAKYTSEGIICTDIACLKPVFFAAVFSVLPMIINWFNPSYQGYGVQPKDAVTDGN